VGPQAVTLSLDVEVTAVPTPFGSVVAQPGETWLFQAWHRDMNLVFTSHRTDAESVNFRSTGRLASDIMRASPGASTSRL